MNNSWILISFKYIFCANLIVIKETIKSRSQKEILIVLQKLHYPFHEFVKARIHTYVSIIMLYKLFTRSFRRSALGARFAFSNNFAFWNCTALARGPEYPARQCRVPIWLESTAHVSGHYPENCRIERTA